MIRPTSLCQAVSLPLLSALLLLLFTSKPVHAGIWVTELNSSQSSDINQPCCIAYIEAQGQVVASGWTNGNAGSTTHTNNGGTDAFVLFLNESDGSILHSILIGTSGNEKVHNLFHNPETDQIVVFGTTSGTFSGQTSSGGIDLFISVIERVSLSVTTFQYGSSGDDEPVDLLFYQENMYLGIGNGRYERTGSQPTNALVLFQVSTAKALNRKEVKVMNNATNGYYGAYAAAPKDNQARFGIAYELSVVPAGSQAYYVTEYNSLFVAQTTNALTKSLGPNNIPISPTALQYSASSTSWWYVASEPGYSNKYYPPNWPGVTNGTSFLIGKAGPEEPLRIAPVIEYDLWFPSALQLDNQRSQYFAFRSYFGTGLTNPDIIVNRLGWQYGPLSFHDAQLGAIETYVEGDNWFLQGVLPVETNGNFFMYAGRWDQEQNVYNCMGTEMRRNFSFAVGLLDRVIGFGDVGSQCPEYTTDAVKGSGLYYYAIGSSTGSLTGQVRNNAGLTNTTVIMGMTYNNSGLAATRFTFPRIFETCELPCESIPPPTPSPTPTPTPSPSPTPTPGPSSSPTPVPIGTATPTWTRTPTPTLGPLPDDDSPSIGVVSGIVVGSVAGAALVNGVGAFIFVQVAASAAAAAAGAAAAGEAEGYYY